MVTRLETDMNDEKDIELTKIKSQLDQILNEHRNCNVTRAKISSGMIANYCASQPMPFRIYSRKRSNCASETSENERDTNVPEEKHAYT